MTQIASYWASLGFRVSNKELKKVDSYLLGIEKKLKKFGKTSNLGLSLNIKKFDIDNKKLIAFLDDALDRASNAVTFEIKKFSIDRVALAAAMKLASAGISANVATGRSGNTYIRNSVLPRDEWDRREAEKQRLWWERRNALREDELNRQRNRIGRPGGGGTSWWHGGSNTSNFFGAGTTAGVASRMYMPALAIAGGGYGMGLVNRQNQEVISAQLTTQAVVEAAGLQGQGPAAFEWLRGQANRIGFSYMDQAQDYNNFLSNSLGAGMSLGASQDIYLGFSEYAKAMGITPARQKLVMNALSQMQGKGAVSMEELRRQMAESMPGTMSVFAQAYQQMTGGSKQGQEAIAALLEAVPTGKVRSAEILPIVAEIMRQRAAPKLDIAMRTSQAEQARFKNQVSDSAMLASNAGVESGFARLFKSFTAFLREGSPMVEGLARGFDNLTKYISFATLLPQSLRRAFEGRDSWIADVLGADTIEKLGKWIEDFKGFGRELKTLAGTVADGWGMLLPAIAEGFGRLVGVLRYTIAAFNSAMAGDTTMASRNLQAVTGSLQGKSQQEIDAILAGEEIKPVAKTQDDLIRDAVSAYMRYESLPAGEGLIQKTAEFSARVGTKVDISKSMGALAASYANDPNSPMYKDVAGAKDYAASIVQAALEQGFTPSSSTVQNTYEITLQVDAALLGNMDIDSQGKALADSFQRALEQFPQKE